MVRRTVLTLDAWKDEMYPQRYQQVDPPRPVLYMRWCIERGGQGRIVPPDPLQDRIGLVESNFPRGNVAWALRNCDT